MFKIKNLFQSKKSKIGLVLGSGGLAGLTYVGVLKVLEENKIYPDFIVGCSIGAIIGAYYSLNPDLKELEDTVYKMDKWDLMKLMDINIPRNSLIAGKKIRKLIESLVGDKTFSDTKIPLKIVATDLEKGEEVIFSKGKLIDAIMASISIPGVFPPVKLKGKVLVDGGLVNPTPVNIARNSGYEKIIAVDLTMKDKVELKNPNLYQTIIRSYSILRNQSTKFNIYEDKNSLILKPRITNLELRNHDIEEFIKEGERTAKENLGRIKKLAG